jgi:hypothetical protein
MARTQGAAAVTFGKGRGPVKRKVLELAPTNLFTVKRKKIVMKKESQ